MDDDCPLVELIDDSEMCLLSFICLIALIFVWLFI